MGPRHCTSHSWIGRPSSVACPDAVMTSQHGGRLHSRRATLAASPATSTAAGIDPPAGIPQVSSATVASTPSIASAMTSQRDGRHSRRQGADTCDEVGEVGIGRAVIPHEPVPELIVLDFQQP